MTPSFLANSMIVGAHPDDELLWFTAIAGRVDQVVIVFRDFWAQPGLGERRARAIARLPLPNVTCLDIAEAGTYGCADWSDPILTDYGMELGREETRREVARQVKRSVGKVVPFAPLASPERIDRHYRANFRRIREALRSRLSPDMNVFTHNPWGEYGHEDHIQVFRALEALREEIGFRLWMSNYCTERTLPLATRYFQKSPGPYVRLPADRVLAERVAKVYREEGCWTWADDWAWFEEECYLEAPRMEAGGAFHHVFPLNLFSIEPPRRQSLRIPLKAASALLFSAAAGAALVESL